MKEQNLRIINNKRKQTKTIQKLQLIRMMYCKLNTMTYQDEREKYRERVESELRHSSEDVETFETRRSLKIQGLLTVYNKLNEKLPHHIRLDLLE